MYNDKGAFAANGHIIRNWNGEGYGPVRLLDILKYSINTGMAEIGTLTGADILSKYVRDYGFGSETGIELPGEGAGILYKFVVLVVIDDPQKGSIYGSQIAAPVFKDIVSQLVRYYQMSPYVKESTPVAVKAANTLPEPKPGSDGSVTLPNFTGFTYGEVRDWLHKAGLAFKPDGTGTATSQDESSGTTVQAGTAITVHFRR